MLGAVTSYGARKSTIKIDQREPNALSIIMRYNATLIIYSSVRGNSFIATAKERHNEMFIQRA